MDPSSSNRGALKVLLMIVVAVILLLAAAFVYWAVTGDPVQAPQAPVNEATIPNR